MKRIAVIGNYLPRQCGIATFTSDLCESLASQFPETTCVALPVTDRAEGYEYPPRVRFDLRQQELSTYRQAADFLNVNEVDVVCLQHEFGIFGGPDGSHVLTLLRDLHAPLVTTLHTIPSCPTATQRKTLGEVLHRSDRVVVMSQKGKEFLSELYRVAEEKIDLIPHGIHDVPFSDPNFYKDDFGVEGRQVLLTFGLLGRNKGIENVIRALPEVLERFPKAVFLVAGATHPNVIRDEGEAYRLSLQALAQELGVEQSVIFHNRFIGLDELMAMIRAADIYVTPYLNQDQITSGTLAYAMGAGTAVISTPYWYAEELLGDRNGILVPFASSDALAHAVLHLLEDETDRHAIRKRAYLATRKMTWPMVARDYMQSFQRACQDRCARPRTLLTAKAMLRWTEPPRLSLSHLHRLTDGVGMLQHAIASVPNYSEGYTTDDNARALLLTVQLEELGRVRARPAGDLQSRYLAFLWHAYNPANGHFRNFMGYDRRWLEEKGSPDSHARSLWALAAVLGRSRRESLRGAAGRLFELTLPAARDFHDLRPAAFALIALQDYLTYFSGDRTAQQIRTLLADRLVTAFHRASSRDWPWFEDGLTYANAALPHALLTCGHATDCSVLVEIALASLDWLLSVQTSPAGHFAPVGNQGFYSRSGSMARFDQQPIEAQATVSACIEAYRVTGQDRWRRQARRVFQWYLGRNDVGVPLYDATTGGCCDGLSPDGVSLNQGAESTLAFLQSLAELRLLDHSLAAKNDEARPTSREGAAAHFRDGEPFWQMRQVMSSD